MTGDDKVVLHERIFLGRYRQSVLCEGEGPVTCIRWRGRFAAWISRKVGCPKRPKTLFIVKKQLVLK